MMANFGKYQVSSPNMRISMKMLSLRPLLAALLAGIMAGSPASVVYAQQPASLPPVPAPQTSGTQAPAQGSVPISLGVSKYNYTHAPSFFPNIIAPYKDQFVDPGALANSPRLEQLIHDGKMNLSLQDAIALALENSMDIVVQRYNPWMADTSLLKTKGGGFGSGVPGSLSSGSTANLPSLGYDPILTQAVYFNQTITPI